MFDLLFSVVAFLLALGVLITIHEFGHFWVARRMGVKVLRFSIGFGNPLLRWHSKVDNTEFVLAGIPLGGYVKMLDEREGDVPADELDRAFNRKSVWARSAIVVAGPLANFLLAIAAYWLAFVIGISSSIPLLGDVDPESPAAQAGLQYGDQLVSVNGLEVRSWEQARVALMEALLDTAKPINLEIETDEGLLELRQIDLQGAELLNEEGDPLERVGLTQWWPVVPAQIGKVMPDGAAASAGFKDDDLVLSADGVAINSWQEWVEYVRARPRQLIAVEVKRNGQRLTLQLTPQSRPLGGKSVGFIGASETRSLQLRRERLQTVVSYGPFDALGESLYKTWQMSAMSLQIVGKLLQGEAALKNISGPITIAQYAGQSASVGLDHYLNFLALISVSLGVLNLLPIPVLDGGHLLFFMIEIVKRRPLSEQAQALGQQIGMLLLVGLMGLAFYNDLARLLG